MSTTRSGRERYRRATEARRVAASGLIPQAGGNGFVRGVSMDLGDMAGETVDPIEASFVWFGEQPGSRARYRVNPDLTETTVVDLFEQAQSIKVTDIEQITGAKSFVREHIHPEDFDRFWTAAKRNRQNLEALMTLCSSLIEAISERPTSPPSGSSAGRPDIRESSPAGVSAPAGAGLPTLAERLDTEDWWPDGVPFNETAAKFVNRFEAEGRPDKADMLMLAQEARAGR